MMQRPLLLALATGLALASSLAGAADRNIQKWVDKNGVVHYGDAPPPDAVKDGRVILNEQGVVVGEVPRQKTPEEAEAAKRQGRPTSRAGTLAIVFLWLGALALAAWVLQDYW